MIAALNVFLYTLFCLCAPTFGVTIEVFSTPNCISTSTTFQINLVPGACNIYDRSVATFPPTTQGIGLDSCSTEPSSASITLFQPVVMGTPFSEGTNPCGPSVQTVATASFSSVGSCVAVPISTFIGSAPTLVYMKVLDFSCALVDPVFMFRSFGSQTPDPCSTVPSGGGFSESVLTGGCNLRDFSELQYSFSLTIPPPRTTGGNNNFGVILYDSFDCSGPVAYRLSLLIS